MKKNSFKLLGLCVSSIGILLIIKDISITGLVISEIIPNIKLYFLSILLFVGGIFIAMSGDTLQAYLEQKEREYPSSSLEGKVQTRNEIKEFKRRFSGKPSFFKRMIGNRYVEQISQKNEISDGSEDYNGKSKYLIDISEATKYKERKEEDAKELYKRIGSIRKELREARNEIKESDSVDSYTNHYIEKYNKAIDDLEYIYNKIGIPFPVKNYKNLNKRKVKEIFEKSLKELKEDVVENRLSISPEESKSEIPRKLYSLERLKNLEKLEETLPSVEDLINSYIRETKTVPVGETSEKYNVYIAHALNDLRFSRLDHNRGRMEFNTPGLSAEERQSMDFKDYYKKLTEEKPMISAISFTKDKTKSKNEPTLGPFGVIIGDGEIFDADPNDMASQGFRGGRRFLGPTWNKSEFRDKPIKERVRGAVTNRTPSHNELIVGRDYTISGIYIDESVLKKFNPKDFTLKRRNYESHTEDIRQAAQIALDENIPLYMATKQDGLQEIEPNIYLPDYKKPKIKKLKRNNETRQAA